MYLPKTKLLSGPVFLLCLAQHGKAQIQAALNQYHPGCNNLGLSRSPDCMAAFHRYCTQNKFGGAGYPQEVGTDEIGFLCAQTIWYGDVNYSTFPSLCLPAVVIVSSYSQSLFDVENSIFLI
jgi:hypothetical protein